MGLRTVYPNTGWVALEVGRQQACKLELQVAFPCTFLEAHDPCFLCPQQICAGPQLPPGVLLLSWAKAEPVTTLTEELGELVR